MRFVHAEGGFELRNFVSNSMEVLENISKHIVAEDMLTNMGDNNGQRTLRMIWKATNHELMFSLIFFKIGKAIIT